MLKSSRHVNAKHALSIETGTRDGAPSYQNEERRLSALDAFVGLANGFGAEFARLRVGDVRLLSLLVLPAHQQPHVWGLRGATAIE